jgi:anionic cell wall polymer biosynthesis LytR-Cps2A-Psr (LCP) family protein
LVFSILLGVIFNQFDYNYKKIATEDLGFENVIDKNIVNVALFGIDTRNTKSFEGNSDSIMILSLNTVTKKVKIVSVVRDTFVPMTYNGITTHNKINSSYQKGGPELAIKTINTIL